MAVNSARHDEDYLQKVMVPAVVQCAERVSSAMGFVRKDNSPANQSTDSGSANDSAT
jgi:hypothetical protein